jgi:hypothetical protein
MPLKIAYKGEADGLQSCAGFHANIHGRGVCRCHHCGSCEFVDEEDAKSLVVRSGVWWGGTKKSSWLVARHWELGRLAVNLGTFETELQAAKAAIRVGKRACGIFEASAAEKILCTRGTIGHANSPGVVCSICLVGM